MDNDFVSKKALELFKNKEEKDLFLKTLKMKKEELQGTRENSSADIETLIKEFFEK